MPRNNDESLTGDKNRGQAFTEGAQATRELSSHPGLYTTDFAVRTGEGLGTAQVSHGWRMRPSMPYEWEDDKQGTLFHPYPASIDMWHGTPHSDSKLAKAYALGRAYNFAKEVSGGRDIDISSARTKNSNDIFNRLTGKTDEETFNVGADQADLDTYGEDTTNYTADRIGYAVAGLNSGYNKGARTLSQDEIDESRNTAGNFKKIAQGQQFKSLAQRRIDAQIDKAKKAQIDKVKKQAEATQLSLPGMVGK